MRRQIRIRTSVVNLQRIRGEDRVVCVSYVLGRLEAAGDEQTVVSFKAIIQCFDDSVREGRAGS